MRDRQLCAVTLAAASVPALLYLPRLGWVWATAAAAISALLLGLCGRRCAPGGLTEVIPAAFGRAGRAVLALVLLGGALLLGGAARALCAIYPESRGGPLTGLLLLLAAAYAAERGEETVLRSGAILFFFLTAVEAVILGFSAVQVRAAWRAPQTGRALCRHDGGAVTHGRALCARQGAEDGRLARGGRGTVRSGGPVRRRHALAPRGRGGGVCGIYHGQERVRLRRDGAAGAGRLGRADGGWLLPAFCDVPRQ